MRKVALLISIAGVIAASTTPAGGGRRLECEEKGRGIQGAT
jgi:hypothetical protein